MFANIEINPPEAATGNDLGKCVKLYLLARHPELRQLEVAVYGGTVRLTGPVSSIYMRQLAVAAAKRVAGVRGVEDGMQFREPDGMRETNDKHDVETSGEFHTRLLTSLTCAGSSRI